MTSTIGEHFRHLLDMFHALTKVYPASWTTVTTSSVIVDYNFRRRGHIVESCRATAISELNQIIKWHESIEISIGSASVNTQIPLLTVLSEVSVEQQQSIAIESSLLRELVFISTHAVHHYAMIKATIKCLKIELDGEIDKEFGIAPATSSYLRTSS